MTCGLLAMSTKTRDKQEKLSHAKFILVQLPSPDSLILGLSGSRGDGASGLGKMGVDGEWSSADSSQCREGGCDRRTACRREVTLRSWKYPTCTTVHPFPNLQRTVSILILIQRLLVEFLPLHKLHRPGRKLVPKRSTDIGVPHRLVLAKRSSQISKRWLCLQKHILDPPEASKKPTQLCRNSRSLGLANRGHYETTMLVEVSK